MISRRVFFGWMAASFPAAAIVRRAHALAVDHLADDQRILHAVADIVLPSQVGPIGVTRFQQWIAGYREGAELLHGYGTSKLEFAGPTPATKWSAQLDAMDRAARVEHGAGFADVSPARRRFIIESQLDAFPGARIGNVARAPHVALALLSHFYASTDATDLCYEAQIRKQTCRPLQGSAQKPVPLTRTRI